MKHVKIFSMIIFFVIFFTGYAVADELMIFPGKGQSNEQMEKDKYDCYQWAKQQSGFDPMAPPTASAPPPAEEAPKGGIVKGAARGAVVGVAVGAIAGDTGKGAAIGATAGGLAGGMKQRDQKAQQAQAQQNSQNQQTQQDAANRDNYNRAFSACLEGKGYIVK